MFANPKYLPYSEHWRRFYPAEMKEDAAQRVGSGLALHSRVRIA